MSKHLHRRTLYAAVKVKVHRWTKCTFTFGPYQRLSDPSIVVHVTRNSSGDEIPERDRVPKFGVGALYLLRPRTRQDFICCCWRCLYHLRPECELPCSKYFRGVLKLMSEHCAPQSLYHLPGNVTSAAVGLVLPSQPLRKQFVHGAWVFVRGHLCVVFYLPSSIKVRDINTFPKLGAGTLIRGSL